MVPIEHTGPPVFRCPVCEEPLLRQERSYRCTNGHLFDIAREGYVNLLLAQHRHSKDLGYNKEMIAGGGTSSVWDTPSSSLMASPFTSLRVSIHGKDGD